MCVANEQGGETCTLPNGNGPCPELGGQRWCDGAAYCSWGKQTCQTVDGALKWGPCIEGDPNNPPNPAPDTSCSCYFPGSYAPQCCEQSDCAVIGQRQVPCGTVNGGGLCAPCGNDPDCASGSFCVHKVISNIWDPTGGRYINTFEQFCSHQCSGAGDCPSNYDCITPPQSPISFCVPRSGTCLP
jgi:hypothetical protein